jgi:hypothetical protein
LSTPSVRDRTPSDPPDRSLGLRGWQAQRSSPSIATWAATGVSTAEFKVETDLDDTDVCCDLEWSGHGE